jgi:hypothetical protein
MVNVIPCTFPSDIIKIIVAQFTSIFLVHLSHDYGYHKVYMHAEFEFSGIFCHHRCSVTCWYVYCYIEAMQSCMLEETVL